MISIEEVDLANWILKISRTFIICIFILFSAMKIISTNKMLSFKNIILLFNILMNTIIIEFVRYLFDDATSYILLVILLSILISIKTKNNLGQSILVIVISMSINYLIFVFSITLDFIVNNFWNINYNYINLILISIIHIIVINISFKINIIKRIFNFIRKNLKNEYLDIVILNISIIIIFSIIILTNFNMNLRKSMFFCIIIFTIIMFVMIQKFIQLYYKQKLLIQDLEETKKELEEKKEEIKKLEQENLNFSKKSHSIAHKQKALEHKLNEILLLKTEFASETNIKDKIDKISEEISKNKPQVELSKTDIEEIDDMLKYMQSECIKNNIDFDLQIIGNIHQMTNNYISKEKLEILLADHIKNAIIAINYSDNINKSILVRLGKIDGFYSLYIYDSGIEFEINTLLKLGVKPSTTHKNSGGTGMGFMNTFDTVREYKASFILEEYGEPSKDDYTKVIMIKFDKKEDFKIISYRKEKIENEAKGKKLNFILNKRNNI